MADEEQQPLASNTAHGIERASSIEQPLTAGGARSDGAAAQPLVPSSLDDEKICRFCLESNDEAGDPYHRDHLIAPCQCRGGSMWVHRGCLDEWRATRSDRAFTACTECHFAYEFIQPEAEEEPNEEGCKRQALWLQFHLLVARDVVKVFLCMQLVILTLGGSIRAVDCDLDDDVGMWGCANLTEAELLNMTYAHEQEEMEAGREASPLSACCPAGDIVNSWWPFKLLKEHSRSAYYLVGLLTFCAIYGAVVTHRNGVCGRVRDRRVNRGGCVVWVCSCLGQMCVFGGAGCVGVLVIICVIGLVFTVAGAMAAAMGMSLLVQQAMQRHMHVLHRREMASRFVVEDLSGPESGCRTLAAVLAERAGTASPLAARTSVGGRAVLSQQDAQQRLQAVGVVAAETPTPQMRAQSPLAYRRMVATA